MVVRPALPAVDLTDLIASFGRVLAYLDANDPHDRLIVLRRALRAEVDYQRAGIVPEHVAPPRAAKPVVREIAEVLP